MKAAIVPFRCVPSATFLEQKLKELATDSENIVFDHPHFRERMTTRGLSMRHALETIRKGNIIDGPKQDEWGDWLIKLSRLVAGRRVQVVVAYKGDHFVAVTII